MASFYGDPSQPDSEASWEEEQEQQEEPAQRHANNGGASDYAKAEEEEEKEAAPPPPPPPPSLHPRPPAAKEEQAAVRPAPAAAAPPPPSLRRRPPHHHRLPPHVSFATPPAPPALHATAAAIPPSLHRALAAWRAFRGDAPTEAAQDRAIAQGFAPEATYDGPVLRLRGRAALAGLAYAQRVMLGAAFCAGAFGGVDPFAGAPGEDGGGGPLGSAEARVPLTPPPPQQRDGEGGGASGSENDDDETVAAIAAALRMLPPPPVHIEVVGVAPWGPLFDGGGGSASALQHGAGGGGDEAGGGGGEEGSAAVTYKASYRLPLKPPPWPLSALFPFPPAVSVWATDVLHLRAAAGAGATAHAEITAVRSRPHNCPTVIPGFLRRVLGATSTWFLGEVLGW